MNNSEKLELLKLYKNVLNSEVNDFNKGELFEKLYNSNTNHFVTKRKKEETDIYEIEFDSQYDLYEYLKGNPLVNKKCFTSESSQEEGNIRVYEMEYKDAVEKLLGGYNEKIEDMYSLREEVEKIIEFPSIKRRVVKSVVGSRVNINAFSSNDPKKYYRLDRISEKKFITIHLNLAYPSNIGKDKILSKGVMLLSLINILENNNYYVKLNSFVLVKDYNEVIYIKINLKDINSSLNVGASLFPLTSVAFFRRCIWRVLETMPVTNTLWDKDYGKPVNDIDAKRLIEMPENDIYIGAPNNIGLTGNLSEDAHIFLDYINMDNYVKVKIK